MNRYKIKIQYDGSNFSGFQSQKDNSGIQNKIESSITMLNNKNSVKLYGASRTDSGVHALGQVAHFDLNTNLSENDLKKAINARLEKEIRISDVSLVDKDFHSRFNARIKEYNYYCTLDENPLDIRNHYYVKNVNIEILNNISKLLIGEHDFLSFSKFSNKDNNRCLIFKSEWILDKSNQKLLYIICGNRFLHHMVRYLVGTMIAVGQNKMTKKEFEELLLDPRKDAKIYKAPAKGLILKEIFYED
jgi:tRNA pseudouridine38-40 synthase|tara:strand:+ start:1546 stop:2283 length:738 start_codon:yes stop_codon:yes gene_type:complete